jgi:hypothetical protein
VRDWPAIAARIQAEGPIPISEAAREVRAERGRRGHVAAFTLLRWIVYGKRGVFLDGIQLSGETWYTSRPALLRFAAELSAKAVGDDSPAGLADLKRSDERGRAMLRAAGLNV